jgi:putative addiction module component (TIGR02574 family)
VATKARLDNGGLIARLNPMPRTLPDITRDVVQLPRDQRLELARILLDLEDTGIVAEAEVSWDQEIRERIKAYDEGSVQSIPYEEIKRKMADRFAP